MDNGRMSDPAAHTSEVVYFFNGGIKLSGKLHLPTQPGKHPAVVVLHSASGGMRDYHAYHHLTTALPAAGFAVLAFDRRGAGDSEGDFRSVGFDDLAGDALAGVTFLKGREDIDSGKIGLWGVSQGGWLAPLAATMSGDVAFVVSVSGPGVSPARQMDYAAAYWLEAADQPQEVIERALNVRAVMNDYYRGRASRDEAERAIAAIQGEAWFEQAFLPTSENLPPDPRQSKWYLEMDYDPLRVLAQVRVPIAFFFGETDAWVPVEESIAHIQRVTGSHPDASIWRIAGADHLMETGSEPESGGPISEQYLKLLIAWLRDKTGG